MIPSKKKQPGCIRLPFLMTNKSPVELTFPRGPGVCLVVFCPQAFLAKEQTRMEALFPAGGEFQKQEHQTLEKRWRTRIQTVAEAPRMHLFFKCNKIKNQRRSRLDVSLVSKQIEARRHGDSLRSGGTAGAGPLGRFLLGARMPATWATRAAGCLGVRGNWAFGQDPVLNCPNPSC